MVALQLLNYSSSLMEQLTHSSNVFFLFEFQVNIRVTTYQPQWNMKSRTVQTVHGTCMLQPKNHKRTEDRWQIRSFLIIGHGPVEGEQDSRTDGRTDMPLILTAPQPRDGLTPSSHRAGTSGVLWVNRPAARGFTFTSHPRSIPCYKYHCHGSAYLHPVPIAVRVADSRRRSTTRSLPVSMVSVRRRLQATRARMENQMGAFGVLPPELILCVLTAVAASADKPADLFNTMLVYVHVPAGLSWRTPIYVFRFISLSCWKKGW